MPRTDDAVGSIHDGICGVCPLADAVNLASGGARGGPGVSGAALVIGVASGGGSGRRDDGEQGESKREAHGDLRRAW